MSLSMHLSPALGQHYGAVADKSGNDISYGVDTKGKHVDGLPVICVVNDPDNQLRYGPPVNVCVGSYLLHDLHVICHTDTQALCSVRTWYQPAQS